MDGWSNHLELGLESVLAWRRESDLQVWIWSILIPSYDIDSGAGVLLNKRSSQRSHKVKMSGDTWPSVTVVYIQLKEEMESGFNLSGADQLHGYLHNQITTEWADRGK